MFLFKCLRRENPIFETTWFLAVLVIPSRKSDQPHLRERSTNSLNKKSGEFTPLLVWFRPTYHRSQDYIGRTRLAGGPNRSWQKNEKQNPHKSCHRKSLQKCTAAKTNLLRCHNRIIAFRRRRDLFLLYRRLIWSNTIAGQRTNVRHVSQQPLSPFEIVRRRRESKQDFPGICFPFQSTTTTQSSAIDRGPRISKYWNARSFAAVYGFGFAGVLAVVQLCGCAAGSAVGIDELILILPRTTLLSKPSQPTPFVPLQWGWRERCASIHNNASNESIFLFGRFDQVILAKKDEWRGKEDSFRRCSWLSRSP